MKTSIINSKSKKIFLFTAAVIFWIAVWEISAYFIAKPVVLPAPHSVIARLSSLLFQGLFWKTVSNSILHITLGLIFGVLCGTLFAVFSHLCDVFFAFASPVLAVIKATPVASFIILALVWLPKEDVPMVVASLLVLPLMYQNIKSALDNLNRGHKNVLDVFDVPFFTQIKIYYIPSVMPYFLSGFKTALGFAWKAGIAGEVLCASDLTIGKMVYDSKIYLETVDLFAWTAVVVIISFILEKVFAKLIMLLPYSDIGGVKHE